MELIDKGWKKSETLEFLRRLERPMQLSVAHEGGLVVSELSVGGFNWISPQKRYEPWRVISSQGSSWVCG